jgi:hypothetical protein
MKFLATAAILLSLTGVAGAKPTPADRIGVAEGVRPALALTEADIDIGSAGTPLERSYFQAPQQPFNAGSLSCRMQTSVFDKMRLTQACNLGAGTKQR